LSKFILFIIKILAVLFLAALLLDVLYTSLYTGVVNTTKFDFIKNQHDKHFNYVFMGSSRVVNHINPRIIDSMTKMKSINFGVMDAKPKDIFTLLQLMDLYSIQSDTLFIQTDYYYNSRDKSKFLYADLLPYIRDHRIITSYFRDEKDFWSLYYFPFYRYSKNSSKLGVRELVVSLKRKNIFEQNKGYIGLKGSDGKWQRELPKKFEKNSFYNDSIKNYLNSTNSKAIFFTAPFRPDTKNLFFVSQLKKEYQMFWDFSTLISDDKLFKNGYHLNDEGAQQFSQQFSNTIISKQ
jgi:hypothetical protein